MVFSGDGVLHCAVNHNGLNALCMFSNATDSSLRLKSRVGMGGFWTNQHFSVGEVTSMIKGNRSSEHFHDKDKQ